MSQGILGADNMDRRTVIDTDGSVQGDREGTSPTPVHSADTVGRDR